MDVMIFDILGWTGMILVLLAYALLSINKIEKQDNYFILEGNNEFIKADKVILATGSCASPKTGSDGIGYKLLKRFNHNIITPCPALVQLKTSGKSRT